MKDLDWSNERYVRVPTRDTAAWMVLRYDAQCLWLQLQRKMDRAGVIPLDASLPPEECISALFPSADPEAVSEALRKLLDRGWLVHNRDRGWLFDPEFLARDEATMSDRQRQQESRAKRRDTARSSQIVTDDSQNVTKTSQVVTGGHERSQAVTPILSDPIRSEPSGSCPEPEAAHGPAQALLPGVMTTSSNGGPSSPRTPPPRGIAWWWPCLKTSKGARALSAGDGYEAPIFRDQVDEWAETYPGIDVQAELRKARQWSIDNPARRKIDLARHINNWLARASDRGRTSPTGPFTDERPLWNRLA